MHVIQIKYEDDEKRVTVGTYMNTTAHNKYVVNKNKLEHFEDVSFRELFWYDQSAINKVRSVTS